MKTLLTILTIATTVALPVKSIPPRTILNSEQDQGTAQSGDAVTGATANQLDNAQRQLEETKQQLDQAQNQLQDQLAQAEAKAKDAQDGEENTTTLGDLPSVLTWNGLEGMDHPRHGSGKSLIIRSSETDPKEQANLEEDLAVMSHILQKSLDEKVGDQSRGHRAMGINVVFGSSSTPFRSLYLDGYGALFLMHVNFPLLPMSKPETAKEKTDTSSTWQEAREELYGQHEAKVVSTPSEQYDEEKVNNLKDALLEALKNASNIRDLKADDSITVCVFGGAGGSARTQSLTRRNPSRNQTATQVWVVGNGRSSSSRATILTIRVRKHDAELFAKGQLTLDDFRKKARMTTYVGNTDGVGIGTSYGFGGNGFEYNFSR